MFLKMSQHLKVGIVLKMSQHFKMGQNFENVEARIISPRNFPPKSTNNTNLSNIFNTEKIQNVGLVKLKAS